MTKTTIKIPKRLQRDAELTYQGEGEARNFRISISSDTPFLRYDYRSGEEYYEVLDHTPGGIDETRLKAGLPGLFNHDRDSHLNRATSYENNGHKCYVDNIVWSQSEFAQEKKRDMENGSLPDTSVGYNVLDDGVKTGVKDGIPVYKFRWCPFEWSIVTVQADITVGAGRSRSDTPEEDLKEISVAVVDNSATETRNTMADQPNPSPEPVPPPQKIDVQKERDTAIADFKAHCKKIDEYVAGLKNEAWRAAATEVAAKHKAGEAKFDEFRTEALNSFESAVKVETPIDKKGIGLSEKQKQTFSLMRAIRQLANKQPLTGFEKEVSDAAAKASKMEARVDAVYLPPDINEYDLRNHPDFDQRTYEAYARSVNVTSGTAGGFTVATQMGSMIELLRNKTVLDRVGVTTIAGLHGDLSFPVQTGGATAYWVGEEECVTDSAPTFAQKNLTPHRLSASIPFTSQFLAQSSIGAEQFLRNELMTVAGLAVDKAGLEGTGTGGEPLGVKYTANVGADITFSNAAVWGDMVDFETYINTANANIGSIAFIVSSATQGKWKQALRVTAGAAGDFLIKDGEANGYPVYATNQITGDIVFFGVWSQLLHAMWDTQEIIVDPYALKKCGGIEITYNSFHDFLVRQPKAFEVSTDSGAQ